mmetsp:Transcript_73956/g.239333  ORF Transcript_73956/g.239333 Transcript_73956/m.239333 type:complete len:213 (-) Transcript_73956:90-728(-)
MWNHCAPATSLGGEASNRTGVISMATGSVGVFSTAAPPSGKGEPAPPRSTSGRCTHWAELAASAAAAAPCCAASAATVSPGRPPSLSASPLVSPIEGSGPAELAPEWSVLGQQGSTSGPTGGASAAAVAPSSKSGRVPASDHGSARMLLPTCVGEPEHDSATDAPSAGPPHASASGGGVRTRAPSRPSVASAVSITASNDISICHGAAGQTI